VKSYSQESAWAGHWNQQSRCLTPRGCRTLWNQPERRRGDPRAPALDARAGSRTTGVYRWKLH